MSAKLRQFKQEFGKFLQRMSHTEFRAADWGADYTIQEFRQWMEDGLVPFSRVPAREQFEKKIAYERRIGNDSRVVDMIENFFKAWLRTHDVEGDPPYYLYHGTTLRRARQIQREGMRRDIGANFAEYAWHSQNRVFLTPNLGDARFFAGVVASRRDEEPAIVVVDRRQLDERYLSTQPLFGMQKAQYTYQGKNILPSAIVEVRT